MDGFYFNKRNQINNSRFLYICVCDNKKKNRIIDLISFKMSK